MFVAAMGLLWAGYARAYVLSADSLGRNKTWPISTPEFIAHAGNANGLSASSVFSSITNSLHYWKHAGTTSMGFDYRQGTTTVNPAVSYDGRNVIYFQSQGGGGLGAGVIGVTYLYSSGSAILETDIVFNDRDFRFTTNPADTTNLSGSSRVFLESVATHELGHAYGLSHSNSQQSSMMWQESQGQSKPSCDDLAGMAMLYPQSAFTTQTGQLSGVVRSADGSTAVFGAHVQAISRFRGTVVAAAITGPSGAFSISNLEPGVYHLLVEPFTNAVSSLCGGSSSGCYFGGANAASICGGSPFKRFFISGASAGIAASYTVSTGGTTGAGFVNVSCGAMSHSFAGTAAVGTAPQVLNAAVATGAAAFGVFGAVGNAHYYKIANVPAGAAVKAQALSFSLYSKVDAAVQIFEADGVTALGSAVGDVFSNASGYVNCDASAQGTQGGVMTDLYMKVTYGANLGTFANLYRYPGSSAVDGVAYYMLIAKVNDMAAAVQVAGSDVLTQNTRCEKSYAANTYADRGPPSALTQSASSASSSGMGDAIKKVKGGCGVIQGARSHDEGPWNGGAMAQLFSTWGLLLLLSMARLAFKFARR